LPRLAELLTAQTHLPVALQTYHAISIIERKLLYIARSIAKPVTDILGHADGNAGVALFFSACGTYEAISGVELTI
jgi:hypothetical protein